MYNDPNKSKNGHKNSIILEITHNNKEKWYRKKEVVAIVVETIMLWLIG
jgi:hypothetical protein